MKTILCFSWLMVNTIVAIAQIEVTNLGVLSSLSASDTLFINGNFNNNAGGNLNNTGQVYLNNNFSNNQTLPLSGSGSIVFIGNTDQLVSGSGYFNNLIVKKTGGSVLLLNNATVNGQLQFVTGNISTGSFYLRIPQTGLVIGAAQNSGWIDGRLQKSVVTGSSNMNFQTGDANIYAPVNFVFPAVAIGGNITVNTVQGDHPDLGMSVLVPNKSVNRYWNVVNTATVNNFDATFNFASTDIDAGANTSVFSAARLNGTWNIMTTSNRNPNNIRVHGYNEFGVFAIAESYIVLPVRFISVNAKRNPTDIDISWYVENEREVTQYEIERSDNSNGSFKTIGTVRMDRRSDYTFTDRQPFPGTNFYRIKAKNFTDFFYSATVKSDLKQQPAIMVYPNPVGADSYLNTYGVSDGVYNLSLYDIAGRLVFHKTIYHLTNARYSLSIFPSLISGKYHLRLSGNGISLSCSLIKN